LGKRLISKKVLNIMTSKRKLEEKIAETKDPVIRKQLQELLNLRNKRSKQRKDKVVNFVKKVRAPVELTEEEKKKNEKIAMIILAFIIVYILIMIGFLIYVISDTLG